MKQWYASKTLWFNLITLGLGAVSYMVDQHMLVQYAPVFGLVLAVGNMALRMFFTNTGINGGGSSGHANIKAVLALLFLSLAIFIAASTTGCAGPNANHAVTAIEITNASIDGIASVAEQTCKDGTLKPDDCAKIQKAYDRVRLADNAVIHATAAAIDAGKDPASAPDYQAAMSELTKAASDLFKLATELGIAKGVTK